MGPGEITRQLVALRSGSPEAMERLFTMVYGSLKALARRRAWAGPRTPTLGATALVHEAYLKLVDPTQVEWRDRGHFFAVAAKAMRQIAVDHQRRRRAAKRGGPESPASLDWDPASPQAPLDEVLAVDAALERLATTSPRLVQVVELCFFAGLSSEEAAEALGVTARTVKRDWRKAKALLREMVRPGGDVPPDAPSA